MCLTITMSLFLLRKIFQLENGLAGVVVRKSRDYGNNIIFFPRKHTLILKRKRNIQLVDQDLAANLGAVFVTSLRQIWPWFPSGQSQFPTCIRLIILQFVSVSRRRKMQICVINDFIMFHFSLCFQLSPEFD